MEKRRCDWAVGDDLLIRYHDEEWGVPLHDDRKLFEFLILDGFQAGLSWAVILKKRENFRKAFDYFDAGKIVKYNDKKIAELLDNKGIIRNMQKINAAISNAQIYLDIKEEFGSFDEYIWQFTDGKIIQNEYRSWNEIPATSAESDRMSTDLRSRGFKFAGPTICYAFMQASGMVNDHTVNCFKYNHLRT